MLCDVMRHFLLKINTNDLYHLSNIMIIFNFLNIKNLIISFIVINERRRLKLFKRMDAKKLRYGPFVWLYRH